VRTICQEHDIEILKGHVSVDHIHILVSVPPHLSIRKLVQHLKRKSSYKLMQEDKNLSKMYRGRHIWSRGYLVAMSGNITDEIITDYIENQDREKPDGNFTIAEGVELVLGLNN
jgi:putative transposase